MINFYSTITIINQKKILSTEIYFSYQFRLNTQIIEN